MAPRLYEGLFLFDANLASRDWPALERHVDEMLKKHAAELVYSERWPDRRLAYEVKGCKKGTYYLTYFHAPSRAISGLERDCQLSDRVLRVLILEEEGVEEELERRRNRELRASGESEREEKNAGEDREGDENEGATEEDEGRRESERRRARREES